MINRSFEAFGTGWTLLLDHTEFSEQVYQDILEATNQFEQRYSRFIETSEVCHFRDLPPGTYQVSDQLAGLLQASKVLQSLTKNGFNVAVGTLMEQAGYDASYSLTSAPDVNAISWQAPAWSIEQNLVTIAGSLVFDIGGIGKGYWIDQVSTMLLQHGYEYHLVDGGGDMFGTQKSTGEGWSIAIEWPGRTDTALALVSLKNQGLAVSDIFKRRWKSWNHLIHAVTAQPLSDLLGCSAIASSAYLADQITAGIAFGKPDQYQQVIDYFSGTALTVDSNNEVTVYNQWPGERFF